MPYINLEDISIVCKECGMEASGKDIHDDVVRYHTDKGGPIRLPSYGLSNEDLLDMHKMALFCELCNEERMESEDY